MLFFSLGVWVGTPLRFWAARRTRLAANAATGHLGGPAQAPLPENTWAGRRLDGTRAAGGRLPRGTHPNAAAFVPLAYQDPNGNPVISMIALGYLAIRPSYDQRLNRMPRSAARVS